MFEYIPPTIYNNLTTQINNIVINNIGAGGNTYPSITYDSIYKITTISNKTSLNTIIFEDNSIQTSAFTNGKNNTLLSISPFLYDLSNSVANTLSNINNLGIIVTGYTYRLNKIDASSTSFSNRFIRLDISSTKLDASINTIANQLNELDSSYNILESRSTSLESRQNGFQLKTSILETSANRIHSRIAPLDSSSNKLDVSTNIFDNRRIRTDISSNKLDVSTNVFHTRLNRLDSSSNKIDSSINIFLTRVSTLESNATRLDNSSNIFESRIVGLDSVTSSLDASSNIYASRLKKLDLSASKIDTSASLFNTRLNKLDVSSIIYQNQLSVFEFSMNDLYDHKQPLLTTDNQLSASNVNMVSSDQQVDTEITNIETTFVDLSSAFIEANGNVFTTISSKASLAGASFTGPIFTSANIILTASAKLKYENGISGQLLTSDSTGLLSLLPPQGSILKANLSGATFTGPIFSNSNVTLSNGILSAPNGLISTISGDSIIGRKSVFSDGSFANLDISTNVKALTGNITTLTTSTLSGTRTVYGDASYANLDVSKNINVPIGTFSTLTVTNVSGTRSIFTDASYSNIDVSRNITAPIGILNMLTTTNVSGTRSIFTDGSFVNIDISRNITALNGTIRTLYPVNITGTNCDFVSGSCTRKVDISKNIYANEGTIPTISTTTILGGRSVFTDASYINIDISNNLSSVTGIINTLNTTTVLGSRSIFTDVSYINVDISNTVTSRTGVINMLTSTNAIANRIIATDGSYTNLDISSSIINGTRCKFIDGSFTNINVSTLKYTTGISAQLLLVDNSGLLTLTSLNGASIGLDKVENTSDASKIVTDSFQQELDKKANLSGATFVGPITAPFINFTNANAKLKYPSGNIGQVLMSDATGALTMVTPIVDNTLYGSIINELTVWTTNVNPVEKKVFQITLYANYNYLIHCRIGLSLFNTTITTYKISISTGTNVNTINNDTYINDAIGGCTLTDNESYVANTSKNYYLPEIFYPVSVGNSDISYNINLQLTNTNGTVSVIDPSVNYASYIYAMKINPAPSLVIKPNFTLYTYSTIPNNVRLYDIVTNVDAAGIGNGDVLSLVGSANGITSSVYKITTNTTRFDTASTSISVTTGIYIQKLLYGRLNNSGPVYLTAYKQSNNLYIYQNTPTGFITNNSIGTLCVNFGKTGGATNFLSGTMVTAPSDNIDTARYAVYGVQDLVSNFYPRLLQLGSTAGATNYSGKINELYTKELRIIKSNPSYLFGIIGTSNTTMYRIEVGNVPTNGSAADLNSNKYYIDYNENFGCICSNNSNIFIALSAKNYDRLYICTSGIGDSTVWNSDTNGWSIRTNVPRPSGIQNLGTPTSWWNCCEYGMINGVETWIAFADTLTNGAGDGFTECIISTDNCLTWKLKKFSENNLNVSKVIYNKTHFVALVRYGGINFPKIITYG